MLEFISTIPAWRSRRCQRTRREAQTGERQRGRGDSWLFPSSSPPSSSTSTSSSSGFHVSRPATHGTTGHVDHGQLQSLQVNNGPSIHRHSLHIVGPCFGLHLQRAGSEAQTHVKHVKCFIQKASSIRSRGSFQAPTFVLVVGAAQECTHWSSKRSPNDFVMYII